MNRAVFSAFVVIGCLGASTQLVGQDRSAVPQSLESARVSFAGVWSVAMVNRAEPVSLTLKVDGQNVSGQFNGSTIVGELKDGKLTFGDAQSFAAWRNGTIGDDNSPQMYPGLGSAAITPDGSLTGYSDVYIRGYGPQPIKRATWTAVRTAR